jgi:hypothetical protein
MMKVVFILVLVPMYDVSERISVQYYLLYHPFIYQCTGVYMYIYVCMYRLKYMYQCIRITTNKSNKSIHLELSTPTYAGLHQSTLPMRIAVVLPGGRGHR